MLLANLFTQILRNRPEQQSFSGNPDESTENRRNASGTRRRSCPTKTFTTRGGSGRATDLVGGVCAAQHGVLCLAHGLVGVCPAASGQRVWVARPGDHRELVVAPTADVHQTIGRERPPTPQVARHGQRAIAGLGEQITQRQ